MTKMDFLPCQNNLRQNLGRLSGIQIGGLSSHGGDLEIDQ